MKILLTGFDPFGGETVNPAFEAVKLLPDTIAGAEIVKQEVPTEFIRAGEVLEAAIQANQPDVVICIGQAGGRSAITPEKVAINLMDGRIADNAGYQPIDVTIQEDGETAYFTSLPVKAMVQNIKDAGIPSALSYTAGSYVCCTSSTGSTPTSGAASSMCLTPWSRWSTSPWAPPAWTCTRSPAAWRRPWRPL